MMNEALARYPTFQPSDGGAPVVTLFGGGVMRVGAPAPPTRAPTHQPPRHAPPPEEDFSHLDPELRDAMRQFAQMERDEAMAVAASMNLPEEPSRVVRTAAAPSVPSGRPSYSPLRVPGEGGGGAPTASTTQPPPTAKLNLKVPTGAGAGAGAGKPSAPKPPVAPSTAPPVPEKKSSRGWFGFGSKK